MTLLTDKFFDSFASSVKPTEEAETLPPEIYTSQEFYEFEKDALFYREWLCVGRDEWLAKPGDYFTTAHANEPIIIARGRDGQIKAMSAVCQHRAMLVAEGKGNTRGFTCPYHHWSYDLDGKLVGAPAMGRTCNFDKAQYNLPKLQVELWHGFIFVNFPRGAARDGGLLSPQWLDPPQCQLQPHGKGAATGIPEADRGGAEPAAVREPAAHALACRAQ